MVSRDHYFVPELETVEILKEFEEIFITTISGEVSSVNEDVTRHLCNFV